MERWLSVHDLAERVHEHLKAGKPDEVSELINTSKILPETIVPYRLFSDVHYTRNLIFKNEYFELLALCWQPGHRSWIHNHHGQHCWMLVTEGTLEIRTYKRLGCDQIERTVQLDPLPDFRISTGSGAVVDPTEPIHLVWNPEEEKVPAMSLHIYSLPFDTCVIYDAEKGQCRNASLFYTTMYGKPVHSTPQSAEATVCSCSLTPDEQNLHCGAVPQPSTFQRN